MIERVARQIEQAVKSVPGTSSAYAERVTGGYYLDITPRRGELARYGVTVGDFQQVVSTALGGEMVTTAVEGLERYGISVRNPRELREDPHRIGREVFVPTANGMIPLGQLADIAIRNGAPGIKTENALLAAYVYVDIRDRDVGSYVKEAQQAVADKVDFPPPATTPPGAASSSTWSGPRPSSRWWCR